ncbi:hypothetical protein [Deinococcus altitudinis]|uniref:hypothetical protein n=1 Tax=Deinococcus altitudinis TaxID=468914 RepID=UPI0038920049
MEFEFAARSLHSSNHIEKYGGNAQLILLAAGPHNMINTARGFKTFGSRLFAKLLHDSGTARLSSAF